jgi:flavin reductase (DIM6/NTAB) family NADH-FMN oxidoreductase RutF
LDAPILTDPTLAYRRALSAFATGVVLVTARDEAGRPVGLIANSFTSVSLEPPRILWCLGDHSDRGRWFRRAERFAVNILAAEAEPLARRYTARGRHHLEPDDVEGDEAFPRVRGALTYLLCRASERLPLADHLVIVGDVERFESREGPGLTYFRSAWGRAG